MKTPHDEQSASAKIRQWEEAGASFADALLRYMDLSTLIGSQKLESKKSSDDLLARIDSSLLFLRTTLDLQIDQLRITLAKPRNRVGCPIYCFPEEILLQIFTHVLYATDEPNSASTSIKLGMPNRVRTVYRRLHNLLAVCAAWRNLGISHGTFWTIIPIFDPGLNDKILLSTELSLQRSSGRDLRLAVFLSHLPKSQDQLKLLKSHIHRLRAINLSSDISSVIHTIFYMLLDHGSAESISKLPLHCTAQRQKVLKPPKAKDYLSPSDYPLQTQFGQLMELLSALRIMNVPPVEFRIDHDIFGSLAEATHFLQALSSAPELRDLKIIAVVTMLGEGETAGLLPDVRISLPNLHPLYLEGLPFTDLNISLNALIPIEIEQICTMLSRLPIDKLILKGHKATYFWTPESTAVLNSLLRLMPTLKTLVLKFHTLTHEMLNALKPPQGSQSDDQNDQFPKLENLEFRHARISGGGPELREFMEAQAHPIRRLVLGGILQRSSGTPRSIQEGDEIVVWLKDNVPGFCLVRDRPGVPETEGNLWPLWDT
ncbi:hypothetical protein FRC11_013371 [Ceratobasidium sp. 423]|nr:hypothetical protein FRC11_013371 [Ceratobasidium sp. 423]